MRHTTSAVRPGRLPRPVVDALICPVCEEGLAPVDAALRCATGHGFDIARQGYVNLLTGGMRAGTADSAEMVRAREEFLAAGHYRGIAELVAETAARADDGGLVIDAGGGTGYHLRAVLERLPAASGLALDLSAAACRRTARAHARAGAVVWDVWRPWPVRTASASVVLNVFAPRNAAEFHRVLRGDGILLVVTPTSRHLAELIPRTGMLSVDPHKDRRLAASLSARFHLVQRREYRTQLHLDAADVQRVRAMGPSAHHRARGDHRVPRGGVTATVSVDLSVYAPAR